MISNSQRNDGGIECGSSSDVVPLVDGSHPIRSAGVSDLTLFVPPRRVKCTSFGSHDKLAAGSTITCPITGYAFSKKRRQITAADLHGGTIRNSRSTNTISMKTTVYYIILYYIVKIIEYVKLSYVVVA